MFKNRYFLFGAPQHWAAPFYLLDASEIPACCETGTIFDASHLLARISPDSDNFRLSIPRSIDHDAQTGAITFTMWYLGRPDPRFSEGVSILKMSAPLPDHTSLRHIHFAEAESTPWAVFNPSLLPNAGRTKPSKDEHTRSRLSRMVSSVHKRTNDETVLDIVTNRMCSGVDRILGVVACASTPYEGLVLTEMSKSDNRIVHKPLMVCSEDAIEGIHVEPLKQSSDGWMSFEWNEMTGMVAVQSNDGKSKTTSVTIYEF